MLLHSLKHKQLRLPILPLFNNQPRNFKEILSSSPYFLYLLLSYNNNNKFNRLLFKDLELHNPPISLENIREAHKLILRRRKLLKIFIKIQK
jgi:hypothetical protein